MIYFVLSFLFAFPELGSQTSYKYSDGQKEALLVLELSDYNSTKNEFLMEVTLDGEIQEKEWLKESDFWSVKEFKKYYETCFKETIHVPAGTFEACRIETSKRTMWFYPLPFLLVLEKTVEDNKTVYRELLNYK